MLFYRTNYFYPNFQDKTKGKGQRCAFLQRNVQQDRKAGTAVLVAGCSQGLWAVLRVVLLYVLNKTHIPLSFLNIVGKGCTFFQGVSVEC